MTTGNESKRHYEDEGWTCSTCNLPVKVRRQVLRSATGQSFKCLYVERTCDCEDDQVMNKKRGYFLSPDKV